MNGGEDLDLLNEAELRDALAEVRPDSDRFVRTVREKIAARELTTKSDAPTSWPVWMQAAASVLPPGLIKAPVPAVTAGLSWSAQGGKVLAIVLVAAPALLLVAVVFTFIAGIRSLSRRGETGEAQDLSALRRDLGSWWRCRGWLPVVVSIGLIAAQYAFWSADIAMVLALASMWTLIVWMRRLGDQVEMRNLAACCVGMTGLGCMISSPSAPGTGHFWVPALLWIGFVGCSLILSPQVGAGDRRVAWFLRLSGFVVLGVMAIPSIWWRPTGSDREVSRAIGTSERPSFGWERLLRVARDQGIVLDLTVPQRALLGRLNLNDLNIAARAGLLDQTALEHLTQDSDAKYLLENGHGRFVPDHYVAAIHALVARDLLTDATRDDLRDWLLASATDTVPFRLGNLEVIVHLLCVLDREEDIATLVDNVREALTRCYKAGGGEDRKFGFTDWTDNPAEAVDAFQTYAAIELMRHYGVPSQVDLKSVRSSLVRDLRPSPAEVISGRLNRFDLITVAALRRLDGEWPLKGSIAECVLAARLEIAVALFVAMCLFVTWRVRASVTSRDALG